MSQIAQEVEKNRGTGAGGANTTLNGSDFEKNTDMTIYLTDQSFKSIKFKKYTIYQKINEHTTIINLAKNTFKKYIEQTFKIQSFRLPDDAYIITRPDKPTIIKIIEKKAQRVEGSVETKLWSGPSLKREYEIVFGPEFIIEYAYCINTFLETKFTSDKKYTILKQILHESNISILYGDAENYKTELMAWINNFV